MKNLFVSAVFVVAMLPVYAQTGPGGVGSAAGASGQPRNVVWLRAGTGVGETGGLVNTWADQSGNGQNATGTGATRPTFTSSDVNFNNQASISFGATGTNKHVVIADNAILDNSVGFTSFVAVRPVAVTGTQAIFSKRTSVGTDQSYVFFRNAATITTRITANDVTSGNIMTAGTPTVLSSVFNGAIANPRTFLYNDGSTAASGNGPTSIPNNASNVFIGAFDVSGGETRNFDGSIAEVIFYNEALNGAQRQIVENYLSAKYNITLSAGDVYAGDLVGNGNYDFQVIGIGRQGGQSHSEANSAGFILSIFNGSFDTDGEFVMAGHNNSANGVSTSNLGALVEQRWARAWYVDKTTAGSVDAAITFDLGEGVGGQFPQAKDNYELLRFDGTNYSIVTIPSSDKLVAGKRITFRVDNASLTDGLYTLGTRNAVASPVDGSAARTWYSYQDGNWNDPQVWTLDGGVSPLFVNPSNEVPNGSDNVVISIGKTVTMVDNSRAAVNLDVFGTLNIAGTTGHSFTTISGNGRIRFSGNVGNDNFPSGVATNFASPTIGGTAEVFGSGINLNQNRTFNRLVVNLSSGSAVFLADYTVNSDLTIQAGTFQINNGASTTTKNLTVNGNVLVQSGTSITTGNANARHQFNVYGNFTVETGATVSLTNRFSPGYTTEATDGIVDLNFLSTTVSQELICNGTCNLYRIEVDKGVNDTHKLRISAAAVASFNLYGFANQAHGAIAQLTANDNAVGLLRGTLEIATNVVIPNLSNTDNYNVSEAATLWVNGGTVNKNNGNSLVPYGKVRVSAGTLTSLVPAGITTRDNGSIIVEGGTVSTNQIRTSVLGVGNVGGYQQSGGTVTVDGGGPGGSSLDYYVFAMNYPGNVFQMSGGTLIVRGARSGTGGLRGGIFINSDPANVSVTGGTVIMEISNNNSYRVTSRAPFWNVTMRRTAGTGTQVFLDGGTSGASGAEATLAIQPLVVLGSLDVQNTINFTTNNADVFISGNWTIGNTGVYTPGTNRTVIQGVGVSTLAFTNTTLTRVLNNLTIVKQNTTNEVVISSGAATAIDVSGELRVERGIFNLAGFNLRSLGAVYVAANMGTTGNIGRLIMNGGAAQTITSQDGFIFNMEINNANGVSLANDDVTVQNTLTLTNGVFNLGANRLTLAGATANIAGAPFNASKMIITDALASAGGLELYVDANEVLTFPIGVAGKYTPARVQTQAFVDDGYVIINPVEGILPTADPTGGASILSYYWRVRHRDFSALPTVSYEFIYNDADIGGTETDYLPGKVLGVTPYTRSTEVASDMVFADNRIIFNGPSTGAAFPGTGFTLETANYTAGQANRFTGAPTIYYSRSSTATGFPGISWHNGNSWSLISHTGDAAGSFPTAGTIAIIGSGDTGANPHHAIRVQSADAFAAEIVFAPVPVGVFNPRVTVEDNRDITVDKVSGRGDFMIRVTAANTPTVVGDFGDFAEQEASTYIYFTANNGTYTLPTNPLVYPNLRFEANAGGFGNRIFTIPANITVNRDVRIDERATFRVGGDVLIKRDLRVGATGTGSDAGILEFPTTGVARTITVERDVRLFNSTNDTPSMVALNTTPSSLVHRLRVAGNITVDKGNLTFFNAGANGNVVQLELIGTTNASYTNTAGTTPALSRIVMNKGTSTATTFTFSNNIAINGATNTATKAIELQNGLLIFNNASINAVLTSGGGDFQIPATAGLEVTAGTVSVSGSDTGILLAGLLRVSGGTVNMNDGVNNGNNYIEYSASNLATLEISAGNLIVGSQIRRGLTSTAGSLKYTQSGGAVVVGRNAAPTLTRGVFEIINTGSTFNHTAGSLTIVRGINSTTVPSILLEPETPTIFTSGTTITIGNANTPAGANSQNIFIRATSKRLANLTISNLSGNNPTVRLMSSELQVDGTLTIEAGATLNANNINMTLRGGFAVNGNFIPGSNTVTFRGTTGNLLSGLGAVSFFNLVKNDAGTLTASVPVVVLKDLTIFGGTFNDSGNSITLIGDAIINATHTSTSGQGLIFAGSAQQQLRRTAPGTGSLGIVTINNPAGVIAPNGAGYNFTINGGLRMQQGVFDIGGALLTLNTAANIEQVSLFGVTNMIKTNSSFTDSGVRKLFTPSTSPVFTFPVGIAAKYTPAVFDFSSGSTGTGSPSITIKTANERNAAIVNDSEVGETDALGTSCIDNNDLNNVLQYNWIVTAASITSSFNGIMTLNYVQGDVATEVYTESDYIPARVLDATGAVNKFLSSDINTTLNTIRFSFGGVTAAGITGQYFAGADCAIPNTVPVYTTIATGAFNTAVYSPAVPGGGAPVGAIVVVAAAHTLTLGTSGANFYRTEIEGVLQVNSGTIGHRLGNVSGSGTLRLQVNSPQTSVVLPAAFYGDFFSCGGGTLELTGNTDYGIPGGITLLNQLLLTGTGQRILPNNDIVICNDLTVQGATFTNPDNRNITVQRDLLIPSGSFSSGINNTLQVDRNLTVNGGTFNGLSAGAKILTGNLTVSSGTFTAGSGGTFTLGGNLTVSGGTFSGGSGLHRFIFGGTALQETSGTYTINRFEVDNPAGVRLQSGSATVSSELLLTNGLIRPQTNPFTLSATATVTPSTGSLTSHVEGQLRKVMNVGTTFTFPIGKSGLWRPASVINTSAGAFTWRAEYFPVPATGEPGVTNLTPVSPLSRLATSEYWKISDGNVAASGVTAQIGLTWGASSDVSANSSEREALVVAIWNSGSSQWQSRGGVNFSGGHTQSFGTFNSSTAISFSEQIVTLGSTTTANPLPVELVAFRGERGEGYNRLFWTTASELNNDYFEVERSATGEEFVSLGRVVGHGTRQVRTEYAWDDGQPLNGKSYYRLKQVDFDGAVTYSGIISVANEWAVVLSLNVSPNPVHRGSRLLVLADRPGGTEAIVSLYDLVGRRIVETIISDLGESKKMLNVPDDISPGIYVVELRQGPLRVVKRVIIR